MRQLFSRSCFATGEVVAYIYSISWNVWHKAVKISLVSVSAKKVTTKRTCYAKKHIVHSKCNLGPSWYILMRRNGKDRFFGSFRLNIRRSSELLQICNIFKVIYSLEVFFFNWLFLGINYITLLACVSLPCVKLDFDFILKYTGIFYRL